MVEHNPSSQQFWSDTMDEAASFMARARRVSIEECHEPMLDLATCDRGGSNWEVEPSALGELGAAFMRRSVVAHFIQATRTLNRAGLVPVIVYAYRTPAMQRSLLESDTVLDQVVERVTWECGDGAVDPELVYERLIVLCANAFANGTHLAGTAVDVMIRDAESGEQLDLGAPYLDLSERTPMASPFVGAQAQSNRRQCVDLFSSGGFYPYPFEFWHYSRDDVYGVLLGKSTGPVRFGPVDVDPQTGEVEAIASPEREIHGREVLLEMIERRLHGKDGT
jgi:D-alanyl-D-alanine dipeptidase